MPMTLTVLCDNRTTDNRLQTEHGLSLLLQTTYHKVLLDTGASDMFLRNANQLGIDLSEVDYVFLSHGHADHAGGLDAFLSQNNKARIIVSPKAVEGKFFSKRGHVHSITTNWPSAAMEGRTLYVKQTRKLAPGFHVIAHIPQKHSLPQGNRNLFVEDARGELVPDDFQHELALYVDGLLFTGCAHNGLENIMAACPWPIRAVVGGFHLLDAHLGEHYESADVLVALSHRLTEQYPDTCFYTSHCTGDLAFRTMQTVMRNRLQPFSCGTQFSFAGLTID